MPSDQTGDDLESAYRSVVKARQWANGLAEERVPRLEDPDEWDREDIQALDSVLEDIRGSVREIGDELLSAQVALEDVFEAELEEEDD